MQPPPAFVRQQGSIWSRHHISKKKWSIPKFANTCPYHLKQTSSQQEKVIDANKCKYMPISFEAKIISVRKSDQCLHAPSQSNQQIFVCQYPKLCARTPKAFHRHHPKLATRVVRSFKSRWFIFLSIDRMISTRRQKFVPASIPWYCTVTLWYRQVTHLEDVVT